MNEIPKEMYKNGVLIDKDEQPDVLLVILKKIFQQLQATQ